MYAFDNVIILEIVVNHSTYRGPVWHFTKLVKAKQNLHFSYKGHGGV